MTDWPTVKLTEARQVATLVGADEDELPPPTVGVRERYRALRDAGLLAAAVEYLGHALPRREAVSWAGRVLDDESRRIVLPRRERLALDTALRWIGAPSEPHRHAAHQAAEAIGKPLPERFLALAIFYSGGPVGRDGTPVPPPAHACARFAVSAIEQAAYRSADSAAFLAGALDLGERVAERGLDALARP